MPRSLVFPGGAAMLPPIIELGGDVQFFGFLAGMGVVGSSFFLPWWGTLLLIAGAWVIGVIGGNSLGHGIGAGGTFPFGLLLLLSGIDEEYGSYALVALIGVTAMGGLLLFSKDQPARG